MAPSHNQKSDSEEFRIQTTGDIRVLEQRVDAMEQIIKDLADKLDRNRQVVWMACGGVGLITILAAVAEIYTIINVHK